LTILIFGLKVTVHQKCSETSKKFRTELQKHGDDSPKTREAETEYIYCMWSNMVTDPSLWSKFIECRNNYPTQIKDKCVKEISA
jgi:hypothetical protein